MYNASFSDEYAIQLIQVKVTIERQGLVDGGLRFGWWWVNIPVAVAENQPVVIKNRMTHNSTLTIFAERLREFFGLISAGNITGETYGNLLRKLNRAYNFEQVALGLFGLQFKHNLVYRRFCEARKITPDNLKVWTDIPSIPTSAFKELELTSIPEGERIRVFHSSGTTGQRPSRHFHSAESIPVYEASLIRWFWMHLLSDPEQDEMRFVSLTPPPHQAPNSSLVHMIDTVCRDYCPNNSDFTGSIDEDDAWSLNIEKIMGVLGEAMEIDQPVLLMGTAFNFVHLLDALAERNMSLKLPTGSRVMETGGYKGRSRTLAKEELHALITRSLGVPSDFIVCEYGMSELSSQAYDGKAGEARPDGKRIFYFPPWARVQVVSPETGREVGEGETGLIRIFDLANVWSVMAIQTEDLGIRRGEGFELIGRSAQAEPRGCSLAVI